MARYFYDQNQQINKTRNRINLTKLETGEYYNVRELFYDQYQKTYCAIKLEVIIKKDFQYNVAAVDFDENTKDLPMAHFDAGMFRESNERVIHFNRKINQQMVNQEYRKARDLIGQILHTIQDFYSHLNWLQMGKREINRYIGTQEFERKYLNANDD